jgi:hypothetical protein
MAGRTSATDPLRVDFLPEQSVGLPGRIGLTFAPGKKDPHAPSGPWDRDLDADLDRLRHHFGCARLVTLLERGEFAVDELALLGIHDLPARARLHGIELDWVAIPDGGVPASLEQLVALVGRIVAAARAGHIVVIHCRAGLGRTGLVAAACLCALGASVTEALATIRATRPGAVEHAAQERCVRAFDELWRRRALARARAKGDVLDVGESLVGELDGARVSRPGLVPLSERGAAALVYLGLDLGARSARVPEGAPLREGDCFRVLPGRALWLGRDPGCEVYIASGQLSRLHALCAFAASLEGRLLVADAGSRNGVWVGDKSVRARLLRTGEEFALARAYRFRFDSVG